MPFADTLDHTKTGEFTGHPCGCTDIRAETHARCKCGHPLLSHEGGPCRVTVYED